MKCCIPAQLEAEYVQKRHSAVAPPTLAELEALTADDYAVLPVAGDCMEGADIPDGGYVAVFFQRFPRPPKYKSKDGFIRHDACLCWLTYNGRSYAGIKQYDGVWGATQMVSTCYKQQEGNPFRVNAGMFADKIFGVVFACWDAAGRLKWQLDLEDYPLELGIASTIHGDNVGDPLPVIESELSPAAGQDLNRIHIEGNIDMVTGWPGSSGLSYNLKEDRYTIQVDENDDPGACLQRGLAEIKRRKEAIVDPDTLDSARRLYGGIVDSIRSREGRVPNNQEIGQFLYICELFNVDSIFEKYIVQPDPTGEKLAEFIKRFKIQWNAVKADRKLNISHKDMLAMLEMKEDEKEAPRLLAQTETQRNYSLIAYPKIGESARGAV